MEKIMEKFAEKINKNLLKTILCSVAVWGLAAHGMMLFNKYSYHDDAVAFNWVGSTLECGRWMLQFLGEVVQKIFGCKLYSLPLVNGVITLLCIAAIVYFLMDGLQIQNRLLIFLLCGVMVTFPAVTEILFFTFTAPYYHFAYLMSVVGAWLFHRKKNIWTALICTVLMACSVGIYQSSISASTCALLLFMLDDIYRSNAKWKSFWKNAFSNAAICIGFMAEYLLVNKIVLTSLGKSLSDYQGINSFGKTTLLNYIYRILHAYGFFFCPSEYLAPFHSRYIYILWSAAAVLLAVLALWKMAHTNPKKACQSALIIAVYPLAACIIYVITDYQNVFARMNFGQSFSFVLLVWLAEHFLNTEKVEVILRKASLVLMGVLAVMYINYSNICYLRADVLQAETIAYCTTLITQIRSTDGYTDETPIVYIGEYSKEDQSMMDISGEFNSLGVPPSEGSLLNNYAWKETMRLWCGFSPELGDAAEFAGNAEVASMPCYPDQGSIRCIDGKIVVKFADEQ